MTDTIASVRGAEIDAGERWARIDLTVDEFAQDARAALAAQEAEAHARVGELFAAHRARLERDLLRLGRDLAMQRGELH